MYIGLLKKYLFACCVSIYLFSSVGMPVYLHYCGGDLEEVSYVVKAGNCCGDDEPSDASCCHNENYFIQNTCNFSLPQIKIDFSKITALTQIFVPVFHLNLNWLKIPAQLSIQKEFPPPKLCQKASISSTILRI